MGRLFGTDGVRGVAGRGSDGQLAMDRGAAPRPAVLHDTGAFRRPRTRARRPLAVVGPRPPGLGRVPRGGGRRRPGRAGVDVLRLGVMPTPAVAYLTARPRRGFRRDAVRQPQPGAGQRDQALRARRPQAARRGRGRDRAQPGDAAPRRRSDAVRGLRPGLGRHHRAGPATWRHPRSSASGSRSVAAERPATGRSAAGLRVVVDCAHGAASAFAPRLLRRAGAEVIAIGAEPDGRQHQRRLRLHSPGDPVGGGDAARGADAGIAHDGDADRCLAVDADGPR